MVFCFPLWLETQPFLIRYRLSCYIWFLSNDFDRSFANTTYFDKVMQSVKNTIGSNWCKNMQKQNFERFGAAEELNPITKTLSFSKLVNRACACPNS